VTYALASAYALTGDSSGAIAVLRRFARLGYWAELTADSDFVRLYDNRDFTDLSRRLERNRTPVVGSAVAFELPGRDLLVEGIAYDPREDRFYLGSVHRARILTVTRSGSVTPLAGGGPIRWAPLGLRVDPKRRALWVATAALPQTAGYSPADSGRSAILRYDLTTGRLTGRHEVQPDGAPHLIGDLIVSRRGDVFATDSRAPVLWRIPAGGDSLQRFLESPLLLSAQGLALTPDERFLYVADYARGILRVDLRKRVVTLTEAADSILTLGIDGLYYHAGGLLGIQNGVTPHRVTRFTLDKAGSRVIRSELLERAHPRYQEPTLGVLVADELYYVANSQWERFGEDGRVAQPDSLRPTVVLRLRL
jgi:sugar lactone lactonase YvrE